MAAKWAKAERIVWENVDGGALLIDAKSGARWTLNATAAALWNWCDGTNTLNDLAARLARHSRRTLRAARAEVREFRACLAARKLLLAADGSPCVAENLTVCFDSLNAPATLSALGLGHGPRTRPGPRGNSSPG